MGTRRGLAGEERAMRRLVAAGIAVLAMATAAADAGTGAGELSLDRGALASLIAAATPASRNFTIPGVGNVVVEMVPPKSVLFVEGGVEAELGLRLPQLAVEGMIALRMVPEIRESDGVVVLRTVRATGLGALAAFPDLAGLMPPISLPRTHDTVIQPRGGRRTQVLLTTQGVKVTEERITLLFGMATREVRDAVPPAGDKPVVAPVPKAATPKPGSTKAAPQTSTR